MSVQCWSILIWTGLFLRAQCVRSQSKWGMHFHLQTSTWNAYLATKERVQGSGWSEKPWPAHFAFTQGLELAQSKKEDAAEGDRRQAKGGTVASSIYSSKVTMVFQPQKKKKFLGSGSLPVLKYFGCFIEHFPGKVKIRILLLCNQKIKLSLENNEQWKWQQHRAVLCDCLKLWYAGSSRYPILKWFPKCNKEQ